MACVCLAASTLTALTLTGLGQPFVFLAVSTSYRVVPNHIGGKNGLHLRPPPSRDSIPTLRITTHLGHHPSHGRLGQQTTMPFCPLYAAPDCPPWASGLFHWKPTHAPIRKLVSKFASISSRLLDPDGPQMAPNKQSGAVSACRKTPSTTASSR